MPQNLQRALLNWFGKNKRNLPWRTDSHWYSTFLSEFLLQQTQVEQALPYYAKFLSAYPNIETLAKADEDTILALWAGLGYYARARNMLKAAQMIQNEYNGQFPQEWKKALKLPGIGPYSAAAILSIAFNQAYAVLDGNVLRVISRLRAISEDIRQPAVRKNFQTIADQLLDCKNPGAFNEAMMELGATICLPKNPFCQTCPLKSICQAYKKGLQGSLPFKSAPAAKKPLKQYVILIKSGSNYFVRQRAAQGLLARMWEFPTLEVETLDLIAAKLTIRVKDELKAEVRFRSIFPQMVHIYSHIHLKYIPVIFELGHTSDFLEGKWLSIKQMPDIALHGAHRKILDSIRTNN